jgi:two-component system C4-dicarboxylate transport sensor histidine kinase DctB
MKPQLKAERVAISPLPDKLDAVIQANAIQLEQVIINLITNGMQAMEGQEIKQLNLEFEHHTSSNSEQCIQLHIDDNGPGFAHDTPQQFFEPFHTTKKNGLGLGLSISQQIIRGINGELTHAKSPLGGARFTICLPLITEQQNNNND